MQRNVITDALILSVSQLGENNRSVCMLTPDDGISYAVLYGGPKSKLKGLVSPFCRGKIYLYCDNVKKSTKITDFDVKNFHLSFRESLFKSWAASLACEIALKTKCAGNASECWYLLNGFLDGLELCDDANGQLGLIRFLWRYLGILGLRPESKYCGVCNKGLLLDEESADAAQLSELSLSELSLSELSPTQSSVQSPGAAQTSALLPTHSANNDAVFDISENAFICTDCARQNSGGVAKSGQFFISGDSLGYLNAIFEKSPKEVRAIKCTAKTVNELKQLGFYLIETAIGQKLKTLDTGLGIL